MFPRSGNRFASRKRVKSKIWSLVRLQAVCLANRNRHERHATRLALYRLDDRQLKDLAMARSEIDSRLEELAQTRARMQQPGWH